MSSQASKVLREHYKGESRTDWEFYTESPLSVTDLWKWSHIDQILSCLTGKSRIHVSTVEDCRRFLKTSGYSIQEEQAS